MLFPTLKCRWLSLLTELGDEIIDAETAAKLDRARFEPGEDVPLEQIRVR